MEKLGIKINRLGAVVNSEVELRPFMIFTGESGLGKSYVAFLSHYVYNLLSNDGKRLSHFFDNQELSKLVSNAKAGDEILEVKSAELFDWINKDAIRYIAYLIGHDNFNGDIEISWPFRNESISFRYDEEMAGLNNHEEIIYCIKAENFTYRILANDKNIEFDYIFQTLICAILSKSLFGEYNILNKEYILPPSRGALMEMTERQAFRSGMYLEFFKLKDSLASPSADIQRTNDKTLQDLLQRLNHGLLTQTDNNIMYLTNDGVTMPLTAAASSVKELAPFTMLLNKFSMSRCSILLEEPESHLHPERQNYAADLIGYALSKGCHMQITTHSDYFIKRLNLLVQLYGYKDRSDEQFDELLDKVHIERATLINPTDIKAYFLERQPDGSSKVKELDIAKENMIPFDSFQKTILEYFNALDEIHAYSE
jgi:hypothetical protein